MIHPYERLSRSRKLRAAYREEQQYEAFTRQMLADTPTEELSIIRPGRPVLPSPKETKPLLKQDEWGRPYLKIVNPYEHTFALVEAAVERFYELEGNYPTFIFLSAFRYLTFGWAMAHFYPKRHSGPPIPYDYEGAVDYDVLVRGEMLWIR